MWYLKAKAKIKALEIPFLKTNAAASHILTTEKPS
jgi:hypothetical protein